MNKSKILEFLILLIIIISIIVIYFFVKQIFSEKIEESTANEIENYNKIKIYTYSLELNDIDNEKYKYLTIIDPENSSYMVEFSATDGFIDRYKETITLAYIVKSNNIKKQLIKHCNNYNEFEYNYHFLCKYDNTTLVYENSYILTKINTEKIPTPIEPNYPLKKYLTELDEKGIKYKLEQ